MKWYIPKEHGAWAMVIVPYWIGAAVSGLELSHLIFFIGLFILYFSQGPLLAYIRNPKLKDTWKPFLIYVVLGSIFVIPFLVMNLDLLWISLFLIPLFLINIYFAKMRKERLFINDLVAIVALSSLMLLAYRLTEPALQMQIFIYLFITILFFVSSVFHIKSLIREKKNERFKLVGRIYHIGIIFVALIANWLGAVLAFVVNLVRTLLPKNMFITPKKSGIVEIVNSTLFFVIIVGAHYL